MPIEKISVSLDADDLREARRHVASRELSAYINTALRAENQRRALTEFLGDLAAQFGPIDGPEKERADRQWDLANSSSTPAPSSRSRKAKSPPGRR